MPLTILLIEDDVFHARSVAQFLENYGHTILTADNADTGWQQAHTHRPDVIIVDVVLPDAPKQLPDNGRSVGIELTHRFKQTWPDQGIVVVSAFADRGVGLLPLIREGHAGLAYKVKGAGTNPHSLLHAIKAVSQQQVFIDPEVLEMQSNLAHYFITHLDEKEREWVERVADRFGGLSEREQQVARLIACAYTNDAVAQTLNLATKSIETHMTRIYKKLDVAALAKQQLRKSTILAKGYTLYKIKETAV